MNCKPVIRYATIVLGAILLSGCEVKSIVPDDNVQYEFFTDCLWIPKEYDDLNVFPSPLNQDLAIPLYFTIEGKAIFIKFNDTKGVYEHFESYAYMLNEDSHIMALKLDNKNYFFAIDRISETHMTLFYKGDNTKYIIYTREPFPEDDMIDYTTYPK